MKNLELLPLSDESKKRLAEFANNTAVWRILLLRVYHIVIIV